MDIYILFFIFIDFVVTNQAENADSQFEMIYLKKYLLTSMLMQKRRSIRNA